MTGIQEWVQRLFAVAMLSFCVLIFLPEGAEKRGVKAICSLITLLTAVSFLPLLDGEKLPEYYARYKYEAESILNEGEDSRSLVRTVIERELETYIMDKAEEENVSVSEVSVRAVWSEKGFWYPESVTIRGEWEEENREKLSDVLKREYGISGEKQFWREKDE